MILGDKTEWDDIFEQQLVPVILSLILTTWKLLQKPGPSEREDTITDKLYCALLNAKRRSELPFLIRREDWEYDIERGKGTGRKDIVFFPSLYEEDIYLAVEAKRLNAIISGSKQSLASEYVKEGMLRFVSGKYASSVKHGVMIAYVLDGEIETVMHKIEKNIQKHHEELRTSINAFMASGIRPEDIWTKETHHHRAHEKTVFRIHHLFLTQD
ncbi:hypothetical protein CHISP_3611 [Chitinispirillum alkaliphilum]|nr:hypothetical protein CHISP_3611 [Chitinispirillum alkaliphilum]